MQKIKQLNGVTASFQYNNNNNTNRRAYDNQIGYGFAGVVVELVAAQVQVLDRVVVLLDHVAEQLDSLEAQVVVGQILRAKLDLPAEREKFEQKTHSFCTSPGCYSWGCFVVLDI